jgi:ATP-dependent DNA helicase RecQ
VRAATAHGLLTATEHGGLALGPGARALLKGEIRLEIAEPQKKRSGARRKANAAPNPTGDPLFEALRAKRAELAKANAIPAYIIFHDSVLRDMAQVRPTALRALGGLPGVGAKKLETWGDDFCAVVREFAA